MHHTRVRAKLGMLYKSRPVCSLVSGADEGVVARNQQNPPPRTFKLNTLDIVLHNFRLQSALGCPDYCVIVTPSTVK